MTPLTEVRSRKTRKWSFSILFGRGTWNRTTILGFGDPYTNRCTMPLSSIIVPDKRANENVLHGKTNK